MWGPHPTYIRCIPPGRRAVPFVSVCVCVLGGGWGPPPTIIVSWTTKGDTHTRTRKNERKSLPAVEVAFCKKANFLGHSVFWGAKRGLGRGYFRGFWAPRIALGRHFGAIYQSETGKMAFLETRKMQKMFWTDGIWERGKQGFAPMLIGVGFPRGVVFYRSPRN